MRDLTLQDGKKIFQMELNLAESGKNWNLTGI